LLCTLLAAYACARILEAVSKTPPSVALIALDVLCALAFALVHGTRHYGLRGILVFTAICIVVGNVVENIGVATGFPFGHYYFGDLMGPKLFHVPVLLGLAYIGMAYVSWTLAQLIVGRSSRLIAVPLVASFVMVAWDLAQDAVWATILHGWYWLDGGAWFGVPISNYLGWFGNIFVIYVLFAFYLRRGRAMMARRRLYWRSAVCFYIFCAAGNVMQLLHKADPAIVQDPAGRTWHAANILAASALVSIFVMGAFAALAWLRMPASNEPVTG
jgi:uncharacterized membrane protein